MDNYDDFSGIPALDDTQGLEEYLTRETLTSIGLPPPEPTAPDTPAAPAAPAGTEGTPAYTQEQIAQIIAQNQQFQAQLQQMQQNRTAQGQGQNAPAYSPKQAAIIKQLIDNGVPLNKIQEALQRRTQNGVDPAIAQRLQAIEQRIAEENYQREYGAFEQKMTSFGREFGLSENDLVAFGNAAMAQGINIANVPNVETVFRAIFPDQYAIRSQRRAAQSGGQSSRIYGGASASEVPGAAVEKLTDNYVEAFMRKQMPNHYNQKS